MSTSNAAPGRAPTCGCGIPLARLGDTLAHHDPDCEDYGEEAQEERERNELAECAPEPPEPPPTYAIIHVSPAEGSHAWPIVQRVPGGWQSGGEHYPDSDVLDVQPLRLVPVVSGRRAINPERLVVVNGWICEDTGEHDCNGGGAEFSGAHEPGCGVVQVMPVEDVPALLAEVDRLTAEHAELVQLYGQARAEADAARAELDGLRAYAPRLGRLLEEVAPDWRADYPEATEDCGVTAGFRCVDPTHCTVHGRPEGVPGG